MAKKRIIWFLGVTAVVAAIAGCSTLPARRAATGSNLQNVRSALEMFRLDNGRYPTEEEGLGILARPARPGGTIYLTGEPRDAWGKPFRYRLEGGLAAIESAGPDGVFGTADDIAR
jgi:general secretion pathway protein G